MRASLRPRKLGGSILCVGNAAAVSVLRQDTTHLAECGGRPYDKKQGHEHRRESGFEPHTHIVMRRLLMRRNLGAAPRPWLVLFEQERKRDHENRSTAHDVKDVDIG